MQNNNYSDNEYVIKNEFLDCFLFYAETRNAHNMLLFGCNHFIENNEENKKNINKIKEKYNKGLLWG